jgi:Putative transposase
LQNPDFLFPAKVLALRFRHRLQQALQAHPALFQTLPSAVWTKAWNVDLKAVGGGEPTLKYLSAYIFRTALSSTRVLRDEKDQITFHYKDGADGQWKITQVSALEFIRRFLQHILPKGWQRVRYFGWFSAPAKRKWRQVLDLLDWLAKTPLATVLPARPMCPKCQQPLSLLGRLPRCRSPSTSPNVERAT